MAAITNRTCDGLERSLVLILGHHPVEIAIQSTTTLGEKLGYKQ